QGSDVLVRLELQRRRQHSAGALPADLVQRHRQLLASGPLGHYAQHGVTFLAGAPTPTVSFGLQRGRYAAPSNRWPIHNFRSYLAVVHSTMAIPTVTAATVVIARRVRVPRRTTLSNGCSTRHQNCQTERAGHNRCPHPPCHHPHLLHASP